MRLYSYVVEHDHGWAPNPQGDYCTLVYCKFSKTGRRKNLVEEVSESDWILGTGGTGRNSSGHGTILYLMRVDRKMSLDAYLADSDFKGRVDHRNLGLGNAYALVSNHFFYLGSDAIPISRLPNRLRTAAIEKRGPGYRKDLPPSQVESLIQWFEVNVEPGRGDHMPCSPLESWQPTPSLLHIGLRRVGRCRPNRGCSEA